MNSPYCGWYKNTDPASDFDFMQLKDEQGLQMQDEDSFFNSDTDTVASSTECTGLIQTPPASENEAESYADLYTVPKSESPNNNSSQHE